jgi:diguanylate cyclase (GGDEF)-like protein
MVLNQLGRKTDMACRYGGEELVMVFPETSLDDALLLAEKLRKAIKALTLQHRERPLGTVTVSVGVAGCPEDGQTVTELLRAADIALYHAKATGRDRVVAWRGIPETQDPALPKPIAGAGLFLHLVNSPDGEKG